MAHRRSKQSVVVIGLGRFGSAVATRIMSMGGEVLAIERNPDLVAKLAPKVTLAVEGDASSTTTLRQLGVDEVTHAVVAIGTSLEASILVTSALSEIGVPNIWAKATSRDHGRILERVGAHRVVTPELEMGDRVAHLLMGSVNEYIDFPNGYAITVVPAPKWMVGLTIGESHLTSRRSVFAVGIERAEGEIEPISARTRVHGGDRLIIGGKVSNVENFTLDTGD